MEYSKELFDKTNIDIQQAKDKEQRRWKEIGEETNPLIPIIAKAERSANITIITNCNGN